MVQIWLSTHGINDIFVELQYSMMCKVGIYQYTHISIAYLYVLEKYEISSLDYILSFNSTPNIHRPCILCKSHDGIMLVDSRYSMIRLENNSIIIPSINFCTHIYQYLRFSRLFSYRLLKYSDFRIHLLIQLALGRHMHTKYALTNDSVN